MPLPPPLPPTAAGAAGCGSRRAVRDHHQQSGGMAERRGLPPRRHGRRVWRGGSPTSYRALVTTWVERSSVTNAGDGPSVALFGRIGADVAERRPVWPAATDFAASAQLHCISIGMASVLAPRPALPAAHATVRRPPRPARALLEPGGQGSSGAGPGHHEQQQQPSIQHPLFPEAERQAALGRWRVQTQRGLPLFQPIIPDRPCPACGGAGKSTCGDCRWAGAGGST